MVVLLSLTFPCVVRTLTGSCSKAKRFELVGTGFALLNHEIKRVTVVSSLDCAMECTATRECRSFSFNSNESVQGNCQLNDATQSICSPSECKKSDGLVHYEASQVGCLSSPCMNLARCLESCSGESTFKCECAHKKTYGDRCEFWTADADHFNLHFPFDNTSNFVVFDGNINPLETFTLCLWLQTSKKGTLILFSYGSATYFQCSETGKCVLVTEGKERAFYIAPINDGHWHHLCLSKQYPKDSLNLFVDSLKGLPDNKAANLVRLFEGREQLILGQRALPNQRLNGSFQGKISHFNIWSRWINISREFMSYTHNCSSRGFGDHVDWRLLGLQSGLRGDVRICPSNATYLDSTKLYSVHFGKKRREDLLNVTAIIPQELIKFTMCLWIYAPKMEKAGAMISLLKNDTFSYFGLKFKGYRGMFNMNEKTVRWLNFPLLDKRSHFFCSLWDSTTGHFEVMVDGKVASIDELQRVYSFPAQTKLVLGRAFGQSALAGYVGGLNIWGTILEKRTIVALYRGNGRESGNVFSWFALKDDIPGALLPLKEAINSEDVHKEEESDFTLYFPTLSTKNVANTSFSVKDTVKRFTVCAWYKTEEKGTLFQYVPYNKDSMNDSFLLAVSSDGNLDIRYGEDKGNTTSLRLTDNQWHHVCFTWRRLAVSVNIYSVGELSAVMNLKTDCILNISGNFIIGQGFDDSKSNFVPEKSFVGKITGVNFWDILLDFNTIVTLSRDCRSSWGTEVSWGSFRNGFHGDVQLIENSECLVPDYTVQSLRDDRCNDKHAINSYNCPNAMKALFGRVNSTSGRLWRCYSESALERDSINGVLIFNHRTGRQECIVDAHEELLTIT